MGTFYNKGSLVKRLNATSIALIPKKKGVMKANDFRPESLLGSDYKII